MGTAIGGYRADTWHFKGEDEDSSLFTCIRQCLYADLQKQKTFGL